MAAKARVTVLEYFLKQIKIGNSFDSLFKTVNIVSIKDGTCTAEFTVREDQANRHGHLHEGFSAFLVDVVSGIAIIKPESKNSGLSLNMKFSYLKPAKIGEQVVVVARTIKEGNNLGFLEVELKNKQTGELYVTGSHTKFVG